jgi:flagellar biosynthesis component FlhA|tara:strand:+ start:54 stop:314 length:261 start_codon:yes stop_codon:yes gene_type:complete
MKYIITETHSLFLKRRLKELDQHVKESFKMVDPNDYSYHDFVEEISQVVADNYRDNINSDNLENLIDYVRDNYWKLIEDYYMKHRR